MDASVSNLIGKNKIDHNCLAVSISDAIECAPKIFCRILVGALY